GTAKLQHPVSIRTARVSTLAERRARLCNAKPTRQQEPSFARPRVSVQAARRWPGKATPRTRVSDPLATSKSSFAVFGQEPNGLFFRKPRQASERCAGGRHFACASCLCRQRRRAAPARSTLD